MINVDKRDNESGLTVSEKTEQKDQALYEREGAGSSEGPEGIMNQKRSANALSSNESH